MVRAPLLFHAWFYVKLYSGPRQSNLSQPPVPRCPLEATVTAAKCCGHRDSGCALRCKPRRLGGQVAPLREPAPDCGLTDRRQGLGWGWGTLPCCLACSPKKFHFLISRGLEGLILSNNFTRPLLSNDQRILRALLAGRIQY